MEVGMLLQKRILTIGILSLLLATGCSSQKKVSPSENKSYEEAKSREATVAAATEAGAKKYVEIKF